MGASIPKQQFPQSKHYTILDYGYCKVWKRTDTQRQTMQQYEIVIQSERMLESYKQMWLLRAQEEAVVGVYYFTHRANKEICGFYQNGSILAERIPYRLSQFCNIPYQEMLYILKVALNSFKLLYSEYGLFLTRSTMIGINFQKQVKTWHHTDYSAAQPQNANCRSLSQMIDSIIESLEINAELPYYYPKFSDFMKINKNKITPTFDDVLKALASYIKMNRIPKCQSLPKLSNYLRQAEGWEEVTYNSNFLSNLSNINQLNKSSFGKYSFKGNSDKSSISSSRKTLKNSPGFNIYTQKQVSQRSKERSELKSTKSQRLDNHQPKYEKYQYINRPPQFKPDLKSQQDSLIRAKSIEAVHFNKIQIKIPSKKVEHQPYHTFKPETISSIDRRLQNSPHQPNSIYYANAQNEHNHRTNRFYEKALFHDKSESRSPTPSKLYFNHT